MVYDTVILSKGIIVEEQKNKERNSKERVLHFNLLEDYKSLLDRIKRGGREKNETNGVSWLEGILLDIKQGNELLTLQALCSEHKVEQIHSKRIVLTSYSNCTNSKNVSMYELLWAAGVVIDSITLRPILTHEHETSIPGLFFYEQVGVI